LGIFFTAFVLLTGPFRDEGFWGAGLRGLRGAFVALGCVALRLRVFILFSLSGDQLTARYFGNLSDAATSNF
jgi:hypothetical protein